LGNNRSVRNFDRVQGTRSEDTTASPCKRGSEDIVTDYANTASNEFWLNFYKGRSPGRENTTLLKEKVSGHLKTVILTALKYDSDIYYCTSDAKKQIGLRYIAQVQGVSDQRIDRDEVYYLRFIPGQYEVRDLIGFIRSSYYYSNTIISFEWENGFRAGLIRWKGGYHGNYDVTVD
jgi:hypothetical protein